jgi:phage terminase large subunit-like protein
MRSRCAALLFVLGVLVSAYAAQQYIDDVLNDRVTVGTLAKRAVERHVRDLDRQGSEGFPYYFDEAQARRVIDFKQQLRHVEGEWANPRVHDPHLRLEPWQQFKDWVLFGWRRESGYRRFTKAYITVARKNGKTTDAAATANYCYMADRPREYGPQVYFVGPKKDQGKIAWKYAKLQIERHPVLRSKTRVYKQNSVITLDYDGAAQATVWGKDAEMQDGFNPSFALIDEAHLFPGHESMEVIESGMGARSQPLIYIITTAGMNIQNPVYQDEHQLAVQMLEGTIEPIPENFFALIYQLDEEDDWTDETVWPKANPNIGVSVSWDYLRERVQTAMQMPSRQNAIITKNFNRWTQAETRWIGDDDWMKCNAVVSEDDLAGRECFAGIDLSSNTDITAVALVFPPRTDGGLYRFVYRFFIPGEELIERERRDKVPYAYWVQKGYVIATPGKTIDHDLVEQEIINLASTFKIVDLAYDPWQAANVVQHLEDAGFLMVPMYQRYSYMAAPTKEFERLVLQGNVAHGGHPVMRWMISSAEVKSDRQGNIMPMKPRHGARGNRIDGVVASIMGLDRAIRHREGTASVYESRGILSL